VSAAVLAPPLHRAVSRHTGIVSSLEESLHARHDPPLFRFSCQVGRGAGVLGAPLDHLSGIGGSGLDRASAAAAAVGEALERYSATFVPHDRLVTATARELGEGAVEPERFALFSEAQHRTGDLPFVPFTSDTPVTWVRGSSLPRGRAAFLPAELVFLGDPVAAGNARIGHATSSGMACAADRDEALVRGLCEVLERDAFMIAWANRLSLPLIDWAADDAIRLLDRTLFAPTGLRYAAVDLSLFHRLPTVLGVVRGPAGRPGALGVGAGTAANVERAWWKALAEAFAARSAGIKLALVQGNEFPDGPRGVRCFEDHIRYYEDERRAAGTAFLDAGLERVDAASIPTLAGHSAGEVVEELCARVEAAGSSAYAVDVTSPDVRELGLTVIKVLAPELCSLDVVHSARFLGGRRLYETAADLGLRGAPLPPGDVNPEPHPFP
jgi:ribosomal protein S12 methylthiotransferase accessory factor